MKTITRLIISISIFSLVFSWSSLCSSSNLLYYHTLHYFTTNSFHLKSIAMSKNSIFLICNGILVFLAKTSPFVCPPSASGLDDMLQKRVADGLPVEREVEILPDNHIILLDENDDDDDDEDDQETKAYDYEEAEEKEAIGEEEIEVDREFEHSNERGDEVSSSAENDLQISSLFDNDAIDDGDQVEEEVDEIEKLSNEELNKKFEDFIRKMKEEFKTNEYQHQRQLVVVK